MAPLSIRERDVIPENTPFDRESFSLDFPELGQDCKPKNAFIIKQGDDMAVHGAMLQDVFRRHSYLT